MNSDGRCEEEVHQGFLLFFCSYAQAQSFGSAVPLAMFQASSSDRSSSSRRSGISRVLIAAAAMASAIVRKVSTELIETP